MQPNNGKMTLYGKDFVMSWQKRSIQLILGLPISLPIVTYAVNIGDTYVQSQQNQPLNASINVSDIDPATFSVKLADGSAYQQFGLSKEDNVNVSFQPTSSNGGKIVITSSKPLNTPFADVVLNVTNKGETKTLPKTLLLPIDDAKQVVTQSNTELVELEPKKVTLGSNTPVNLPVIDEPMPISVNEPVKVETNTPVVSNPVSTGTVDDSVTLKGNLDPSKSLLIQETRRVITAGSSATEIVPSAVKPSEKSSIVAVNPKDTPATTTPPAIATDEQTSQEMVTYVIQRNDNLWTIANDLAKQNKTDVNKVMKDIVAANPNAFENGDPNKLLVNSELQVPKYQVMPSQLGIKAANAAKKQTRTTVSKKPATKSTTTVKRNTTPKTTKQATQVARKSTRTVTKPVTKTVQKPTVARRTEMKIIAPSQKNGSNQGSMQSKTVAKNGQSPQIVTQVQQKRQVAAKQATKVGQLNQSLVSAEKRLKLQNAKLAQLEQRLKELNKK